MIIYGPMEGELSDKSPRGTSSGMEKCFNSSQLHAPHAGIRDHGEMSSGVPFLFIEMECLRRFCWVHLGRRYWMGVLQFCVVCIHPVLVIGVCGVSSSKQVQRTLALSSTMTIAIERCQCSFCSIRWSVGETWKEINYLQRVRVGFSCEGNCRFFRSFSVFFRWRMTTDRPKVLKKLNLTETWSEQQSTVRI